MSEVKGAHVYNGILNESLHPTPRVFDTHHKNSPEQFNGRDPQRET